MMNIIERGLSVLRSGERGACVGHAADVSGTALGAGSALKLSEDERKLLLALARQALVCVLTNTSLPEGAELSTRLTQRQACFVTLTNQGVLRGCVGQLTPQGPLYRTVIENVQGAALRDPRFPVITAEEIGQLKIEISLLS